MARPPMPGAIVWNRCGLPRCAVWASIGKVAIESLPRSLTTINRLSGESVAECGCDPFLLRLYRSSRCPKTSLIVEVHAVHRLRESSRSV